MTDYRIQNERQREIAIDAIRALDLSKPRVMTLKVRKSKRSLNQNSLFHQWVSEIATATGNDNEGVKEALKDMFLPPRIIDMNGQLVEVRRSTAALTVDEMRVFMDKVEGWAGGEGIALTNPLDMYAEAMR